jgi:hypothetical protein
LRESKAESMNPDRLLRYLLDFAWMLRP